MPVLLPRSSRQFTCGTTFRNHNGSAICPGFVTIIIGHCLAAFLAAALLPRCRPDRAINILLRLIIIAVAGFGMWEFSDLILMEMHHLARPFNLFTLAGGVFGPGFAIAAIVLAAANKHLPLAALSSVLAIVILVTPLVVFIFSFAK